MLKDTPEKKLKCVAAHNFEKHLWATANKLHLHESDRTFVNKANQTSSLEDDSRIKQNSSNQLPREVIRSALLGFWLVGLQNTRNVRGFRVNVTFYVRKRKKCWNIIKILQNYEAGEEFCNKFR